MLLTVNEKMPQHVSGLIFPDKVSPFEIQLWLFRYGNELAANPTKITFGGWNGNHPDLKTCYNGEGRFEHFKILAQMCFPKTFEWNEWAEKLGRSMCEGRHFAVCGCAGSGKSATAGLYAFFWWFCDPNNSAILVVSTTIDAAKKRIWKNIRQYYSEFLRQTGGALWVTPNKADGPTAIIGNPKPCIRSSEKDVVHGIYVVAVAKGEVEKGVESLKGFHPNRLMMIVDETDAVTDAVIEVMPNQEVGTIEYQTVWLGNDPSLFNPLGKIMQPEVGKPITLQHIEWTSHNGTNCIRLDAYDSPNIRDGDKWKGIVRQKDIDSVVARHGPNSPQVWIMLRGIHPPEGADDTVLSEALFLRNQCQATVVWKRGFTTLGLLDPAFGGDRCVFRTMDYGLNTENQMKVLIGPPVEIRIDAGDTKNPPEYQIAQKVKSLCESKGIKPEDFVMDKSGTGRGTFAVLQREWSPNIKGVEFGGACSSMPISDEEPTPAIEVYDRKVTELWYSFRVFVEAGMIRGLDPTTAMEFCARKFYIKSKKTCVETKTEMKLRGAPSPDLADCVVVGIQELRERGVNATVMTDTKREYTDDYSSKLHKHDIDGEGTYASALDDNEAYSFY